MKPWLQPRLRVNGAQKWVPLLFGLRQRVFRMFKTPFIKQSAMNT